MKFKRTIFPLIYWGGGVIRWISGIFLVCLLFLLSSHSVFAGSTEKPMLLTNNDVLLDDFGFRMYDKDVPVSITYGPRMTWKYYTWGSGGKGTGGAYSHWSLVSTNTNRRFSGGEWVEITYSGVGMCGSTLIDVKVRFDFRNSADVPGVGVSENRDNLSQLRLGENFTNWTDRNYANFVTGFTYFYGRCTDVSYEFYEHGTSRKIAANECWFSWGSTNVYEGVSVFNYDSVSYYKKFGSYVTVEALGPYGDFTYRGTNPEEMGVFDIYRHSKWGISADWMINVTSNDFTDNFRDGPTFWKSIGTCRIRSSSRKFQFHCYSDSFWFAPSLAPVGPTAPAPVKSIVDGSSLVNEVIRHSGDTVTYEISQGVEIYGYLGTGYDTYSNFSFSDTLPSGVTYQSARVLKRMYGMEWDVTSEGTLSYSSSSRTVSFAFDPHYLERGHNGMSYVGEDYVLEITVELGSADASRVLTNTASTTICNTLQTTNAVDVYQYYYPQSTYVRHRDVNGNWSDYVLVDSQMVERNDAYHYTWERNLSTEPVAVYYDGNPATVGTDAAMNAGTYYISVDRKQYTYTFDVNPPDGYAVIGIGNVQENLVDKWAETVSGSVKSPRLTGYTFLGWNTKRDGSGTYYASESMLRNKDFYGIWRKNKYKVRYDANGSFNPNHETGELTQNTVTGVMADSDYEYDTRGTLRTNAFVRKGYTFLGWNTKVDGTGLAYGESAYDISNKLYSDGYSNVYNMTSTDGAVLTLYAQWKRQLGTEVLTVVSEETGNPIAGVQLKLYQKVNGTWKERTDIGTVTTDRNGQVKVGDLHWFPYEWRSVSVPDGYQGMTNVGFTVDYDHLSLTHRRILYLKRVELVLHSVIDARIAGESAPGFVYQVSGRDAAGVSHHYTVPVLLPGTSKSGTSNVVTMYAGTYAVTQMPVSRYRPLPAEAVRSASVSGTSGTALLLTNVRSEIRFPYRLRQYEGFGSFDNCENLFRD